MDAKYIIDLILKFSPGIVSAFLASYLASKWSLRKFYAEKWWERKEKAYSDIIYAFNDILQYIEYKEEYYRIGYEQPKEKENELEGLYNESLWGLKKAKNIGEFFISKEAIDALKELEKLPKLNPNENPPEDVWYQEYKNHEQILEKIIGIAKKDLEPYKVEK